MQRSSLGSTGASLEGGLHYWETFWSLGALWRAAALVGATLTMGVVLVGLFPEYGDRGAKKARRRSVTSTFIGGLLAGLLVGSSGVLWYGATQDHPLSMLAIPMLYVLAGLAVVWTGIGVVALGQTIAARIGLDGATWGILAAAVLVGAGAVYPRFGAVVLIVAVVLGFGAGIRTNPFAKANEERVVPPDRKA